MSFLPADIENYSLSRSYKTSALSQELADYTNKNVQLSTMLIGPLVGSYLKFLVRLTRAKRIAEIGCFTGYSALCMAEELPEGGELFTLDIDETTTAVGKKFWDRSPQGSKIKLVLGSADQTLKNLKGPFDLVLIDADKTSYPIYLEWALENLSDRGLILLDNCLWDGKVLDSRTTDPNAKVLRELTAKIAERKDLISFLCPIRDGLMMVQKLRPLS